MEGETLRSRLAGLLQKSRKAVRLYTNFEKPSANSSGYNFIHSRSASRTSAGFSGSQESRGFQGVGGYEGIGRDALGDKAGEKDAAGLNALQLAQWQAVNTDLQRQITAILDRPHSRLLASETVEIRDRFYGMWRAYEAELRQKQIDLAEAVSRGDFIKAALLAKSSVALKALEQATEAAQHEMQIIVDRFKLGNAKQAESSGRETILRDELIKLEDQAPNLASAFPGHASAESSSQNAEAVATPSSAGGDFVAETENSAGSSQPRNLQPRNLQPRSSQQPSSGRVLAKVIQLRRTATH